MCTKTQPGVRYVASESRPMKEPNFNLWQAFQTLCQERNLDPQIITTPEKFSDHVSCARRANFLREFKQKHEVSPSVLTTICGLDERRIQQILRNGVLCS